MYHGPQSLRYHLLPALAILLSGCAGASAPEVMDGSDPTQARRLLEREARDGPVPIVIRTDAAPLSGVRLAEAVADGIRGLSVDIEPRDGERGEERNGERDGERNGEDGDSGPPRGVYLTYSPDPAGGPLCDEAMLPPGEGFRLALCQGDRPVAAVRSGPLDGPVEVRDLWAASARLFPDDYMGSYGFGWFGNRLSIGLGLGF
ncbi:MAG: hypothetical protein KDF64_16215 [Geminicoccaceae bacterium]|nr:hypothetical protein [Geminicoccaceae bacterium]